MTEFNPDCTINLHVETSGKSGRMAWACSVVHPKHGRLVLARKLFVDGGKAEAEDQAILFGLRQAARFLQEKVEVTATFPLEKKLKEAPSSPRAKKGPETKSEPPASVAAQIARAWEGFRLRRTARMAGIEAQLLREEALRAISRKA